MVKIVSTDCIPPELRCEDMYGEWDPVVDDQTKKAWEKRKEAKTREEALRKFNAEREKTILRSSFKLR